MKTRILIPLFCLFTIFFVMACSVTINPSGTNTIRGSGKVVTETRQVSGFDSVSLSGVGELTIIHGDSESLEIEAEDNIIPLIETTVTGSKLSIGFKNVVGGVSPTKPVSYRLTVKKLTSLEVSGAGNATADKLDGDSTTLDVSGAGTIKVDSVTTQTLDVIISGAGNCDITAGPVDHLKAELSGAGSLQAGDMQVKTADMNLSGAGNATVWVTDVLDVIVSGAGNVDYYGHPSVSVDSSGAGHVKSLGDHK